MGRKYSASRIGCYNDCKLKYKFTYVEGWHRSDNKADITAAKGTCFHETVEKYHTGMPKEEAISLLEENIKKYGIYDKENLDPETGKPVYDEHEALDRFFYWWAAFVEPLEKKGYKVEQEVWTEGKILRQPFVGALDVRLNPASLDEPTVIVDYKSGKSTTASKYKNQQLLYAYFTGKEKGYDIEQTAKSVRCYIFFPFANPGFPSEDVALVNFKEIKYTAEDLRDVIDNTYCRSLQEILTQDWNKIGSDDGTEQFGCRWCPFANAPANKNGFIGCSKSVPGKEFPSDVEIIKD